MNAKLLQLANEQADVLNELLKSIGIRAGEKIDPNAEFSSIIGCQFCQFSKSFFVIIPDNNLVLLEQIKKVFIAYDVTIFDRSSVGEDGWIQIIAAA